MLHGRERKIQGQRKECYSVVCAACITKAATATVSEGAAGFHRGRSSTECGGNGRKRENGGE